MVRANTCCCGCCTLSQGCMCIGVIGLIEAAAVFTFGQLVRNEYKIYNGFLSGDIIDGDHRTLGNIFIVTSLLYMIPQIFLIVGVIQRVRACVLFWLIISSILSITWAVIEICDTLHHWKKLTDEILILLPVAYALVLAIKIYFFFVVCAFGISLKQEPVIIVHYSTGRPSYTKSLPSYSV